MYTKNLFITCGTCEKAFHKGCTGIESRTDQDRAARQVGSTQCLQCQAANAPDFVKTNELGSENSNRIRGFKQKQLRILQWNADSIKTKLPELQALLSKYKVDICMIQETKLKKTDDLPKFQGYSVERHDRKGDVKFGGVLYLIKETINHDMSVKSNKTATEVLGLKIKCQKRWLEIVNVYCPPQNSLGQEINLATDIIPTSDNSIIVGDFNAHSLAWDSTQPEDDRGENLLDWTTSNDLVIMNECGSSTRFNRATGGLSSPDVTLVASSLATRCEWSVLEATGNSDHFPLLTTVHLVVEHQHVLGSVPRWKRTDVDWHEWAEDVDKMCQSKPSVHKPTDRLTRLTNIMIEAANRHIGKTKPGKSNRSWLNAEAREAIKDRNRKRKLFCDTQHISKLCHDNPEWDSSTEEAKSNITKEIKTSLKNDWLQSCKDVNTIIDTAKEESWKNLLEDAITEKDSTQLWNIIKSLNGAPSNNAPNCAMKHKGKTITSSSKKATIFARHYASVSRLRLSKEERRLNLRLKRLLRAPKAENEINTGSCSPFTNEEMDKALRKMKSKGACGPDDIPPTFLQSLGKGAKAELLSIFNALFVNGICPQQWRQAIIVPLLKAKKPASELASFRPISLTSCIGKLYERMLAERIYFLVESRSILSPFQAGYRKMRGCEDQIARTIQEIEDGFQCPKMERSVLVLLDFSKAFDTVWREKLLLSLNDMGIPVQILQWLREFLRNRTAKVRFNGTLSRSVPMHQGVPQGSVLSPLLFILYINDLASKLPEGNIYTMFADDVAILARHRSIQKAAAAAQKAVDVVVEWSKEWRLTLNATKCEVSLFSTCTKDAGIVPEVSIESAGKRVQMKMQPHPRLLGVTLDRGLNFNKHVKEVVATAKDKLKILSCISRSKWGWRKAQVTQVYQSHVKSIMDYAGFAWQPYLATSEMMKLERIQNAALKIATGVYRTSPVEARRAEAGIDSYATQSKRSILISSEKALRQPPDHPRHIAYTNKQKRRTTKVGWRTAAEALADEFIPVAFAAAEKTPLIPISPVPPWSDMLKSTVNDTLPGIASKESPPEMIQAAAHQQLATINADVVIYTDGSASGGLTKGGAAAVITTGTTDDPTIVTTLKRKGAPATSSYEEEHVAMLMAIEYTQSAVDAASKVCIVTDSQSLCKALNHLSQDTASIRAAILNCPQEIVIQWVPGHAGVPGNELADQAAKDATTQPGPGRSISFKCAKTVIKQSVGDTMNHDRTRLVYSRKSKVRESQVTSRADQTTLAQIRSGHHKSFMHHINTKIDTSISPACPLCSHPQHDLAHWLQCPGTLEARMRIFGRTEIDASILTEEPIKSLELARRTLGSEQ